MKSTINHLRPPRQRKAAGPPYRRVAQTRPLGETPEVYALLKSEGLLELVTPELQEVHYYHVDRRNRRKDYCAVGWPNENGGFEIRHPGYTGCIGSKGMTFIGGEPEKLVIFEDFTEYLCWRHAHKNDHPHILIINHPEFLNAAKLRALKFTSVTVCFGSEQIKLIKSSDHGHDPFSASA